jgi:hypothetical protein
VDGAYRSCSNAILYLVTTVLLNARRGSEQYQFNWESMGSRDFQRQRQAVIAANPELLERALIKHHSIAVGFTDALRQRGVDADIAQLAARMGIQGWGLAIRPSIVRWPISRGHDGWQSSRCFSSK